MCKYVCRKGFIRMAYRLIQKWMTEKGKSKKPKVIQRMRLIFSRCLNSKEVDSNVSQRMDLIAGKNKKNKSFLFSHFYLLPTEGAAQIKVVFHLNNIHIIMFYFPSQKI